MQEITGTPLKNLSVLSVKKVFFTFFFNLVLISHFSKSEIFTFFQFFKKPIFCIFFLRNKNDFFFEKKKVRKKNCKICKIFFFFYGWNTEMTQKKIVIFWGALYMARLGGEGASTFFLLFLPPKIIPKKRNFFRRKIGYFSYVWVYLCNTRNFFSGVFGGFFSILFRKSLKKGQKWHFSARENRSVTRNFPGAAGRPSTKLKSVP